MIDTREASTTVILHPLNDFDPRDNLDSRALIEASRNAYPLVAAGPRKSDSLTVAVGGGIAVLLGMLTFWTMSGHRSPAPVPEAAQTQAAQAPAIPSPVFGTTDALQPSQAPGTLILPHTQPWGQVLPAPGLGLREQTRAPVMIYDSTGAPISENSLQGTSGPSAIAMGPPQRASSGSNRDLNDNERFASRMGGQSNEVAVAERLSNPASTVTQGTLIAAVLETSINTDLPGYVRALVSRDVRSFDGSRVLIPRSSRLIGQYKSGLSAGQTRAYVIWTRLIRPDGVSVPLDSPAVDFTGSAGLAGKVNSHFMKRFGSALLLSVVGGLSSVATGPAGMMVGGSGASAASVAAGRDGSIGPTIRVAQGEPIRIFTARDLDFSTVQPIDR